MPEHQKEETRSFKGITHEKTSYGSVWLGVIGHVWERTFPERFLRASDRMWTVWTRGFCPCEAACVPGWVLELQKLLDG